MKALLNALGARASRPHANAVRLRSLLARLGLRSPDGQGPAAANAAMLKANAREALTSLRLNPQRTALPALVRPCRRRLRAHAGAPPEEAGAAAA